MKSVLKFFGGLIFGIAVATVGLLGWFYVANQPLQVVVHGVMEAERQQDIEALIQESSHPGSLLVSALDVAEAIQDLPWTRDVKVWRTVANVLHIEIGAKRAMARLDEGKVLTVVGDVISQSSTGEKKLPTLKGLENDEQAKTDAQVLDLIRTRLAKSGIAVSEFEHTIKGWNVVLVNGDSVLLGRDELEHRLERFLTVYTNLTELSSNTMVKADARYEHGVAIKQEANNVISLYENSEATSGD